MTDRVLVLNYDYSPIAFISWKRAITLLYQQKAELIKASNKLIKTVDKSVERFFPIAIRLVKIIRSIYKKSVPYSKANIITRDEVCQYCGSKESLTIDHVIPRAQGGKSSWNNCVAACKTCNNKKADRTPTEAKMYLRHQPIAPTINEFAQLKLKQMNLQDLLVSIFS